MRRFADGQRVRVVDPSHSLHDQVGIVVRLRRGDNGAWIRFDNLPDYLQRLCPFPKDDPHGRGGDAVLYPEQCAAANIGKPAAQPTTGPAVPPVEQHGQQA